MRQAVVLIHGIGEQRPMSTVRGFVDEVLKAAGGRPRSVFSKPDRMSESFELRRLVAEQTRYRPTTDFYEYYWAYHMEGTKLRHLWPWVRTILLRSPRAVPPGLRVLWTISWILVAGAAFFFLRSQLGPEDPLAERSPWIGLGLTGLLAIIQAVAVNSIGDAARYLSPLPGNIAIRQTIRSEGIDLLRRLHEGKRYDRVVVVGHSLGAVIAYDVLTHFWDQVNAVHDEADKPRHDALTNVERLGRELSVSPERLEDFRQAQSELWAEQRGLGFPWLVSDFVTLGSPLAHASILLARNERDLRARVRDRELPSCPPAEDREEIYSYPKRYRYRGQPRSIRILHHAALFAETRWTNVYFPLKLGLLGDWVGGPARPAFGPGILDVPVTDGSVRLLPLVCHTRYWRGSAAPKRPGRTSALGALSEAMALDRAKRSPRREPSPKAPSVPHPSPTGS
jgi:pimeloyl-ACP methyl ester carboxylesterase